MIIKGVKMEDFSNYKEASMFIIFPKCDFKCDKECGQRVCQNSTLATAPNMNVDIDIIIQKYINNPITKAMVVGGLEPFDSFDDLLILIKKFRENSQDTIIIYTGYYKDEIAEQVEILKQFKNIIIKFGRFIPNNKGRIDEVLGVYLASDNQYAEQIS